MGILTNMIEMSYSLQFRFRLEGSGNSLARRAVSLSIDNGRQEDDDGRDTVAPCHHVERFEGGVEDQHHHPEELYPLQTHPTKRCQEEIVQQPCDDPTANLKRETEARKKRERDREG